MTSKKSGHFWELEAWMADHDVDVRGLATLLERSKSTIARLLCGQFKREDPVLKAAIVKLTKRQVGFAAFAAFERRRLADRSAAMRVMADNVRASA